MLVTEAPTAKPGGMGLCAGAACTQYGGFLPLTMQHLFLVGGLTFAFEGSGTWLLPQFWGWAPCLYTSVSAHVALCMRQRDRAALQGAYANWCLPCCQAGSNGSSPFSWMQAGC